MDVASLLQLLNKSKQLEENHQQTIKIQQYKQTETKQHYI